MSSLQSQLYLHSFGDKWLEKNRDDMGKRDPISDFIADVGMTVGRTLEVGCSTGWRLKKLREKYGCEAFGVDPSSKAVEEAADPNIVVGTADRLPFPDESFDLVIMGFCLFCISPEDWTSTVAETDRVLKNGGHIIIWDFTTPRPFKRRLLQEENTPFFMYHFDWPTLWTAHPIFKMVAERHLIRHREAVSILRKNVDAAFAGSIMEDSGGLSES